MPPGDTGPYDLTLKDGTAEGTCLLATLKAPDGMPTIHYRWGVGSGETTTGIAPDGQPVKICSLAEAQGLIAAVRCANMLHHQEKKMARGLAPTTPDHLLRDRGYELGRALARNDVFALGIISGYADAIAAAAKKDGKHP